MVMNQQEDRYPSKNQQQIGRRASGSEEVELDLHKLLQSLNRRRSATLGIFLLVIVITVLHLYQVTPRYTAYAELALDIRKSRVLDAEEVLSGISADTSVIGTEMGIIRSTSLLARAADKLNLHQYPEYNSAMLEDEDKGLLSKLISEA
jgi:polysaccharide biosynthesis transport protein